MKKSFLIIGLGRFGLQIAKTLSELKADIVAIDINEESVAKAADFVNHCAICDSTKISALDELGVSGVTNAIVAIGGNFLATILSVINLKELGISNITVRIDDETYKPVMERLGATEVIIPEVASAISFANQIVSDNVLDFYKVNKEYGIVKIKVNSQFDEITLANLDSRNRFDVNILGIIRDNKFTSPKGSDSIMANDVIMIIGKVVKITKFERFING